VAHRQHVNEGLAAKDIGKGYSATLSPELVDLRGDEAGGLDGHASDAWALGAVLSMLLARDATLTHTDLATDLNCRPAGAAVPVSVSERQRRLYQLVFPANAVPLHLRRESRFAPLIELAERLLRRNPTERPPPTKVVEVLEASWAFLAGTHLQGALGWRVTGRHLSPSDDVREAWAACRSVPWWLRWCVRSQLYWAHVFLNPEAAWRREACIARGVATAWGVGTWVCLLKPLVKTPSARVLCLTFLLGICTPGYCVWFQFVFPHGVEDPFSWVTFLLWVLGVGGPSLTPLAVATETPQAAGFPLCAAVGVALCPLWQALVTWLPAECRLLAVLGAPSSVRAETATSAAHATDSEPSGSWGPFARPRRQPHPALEYASEAALQAEIAALQDLARIGNAPPACTLTAQDACEGEGPARTFRLALAIDVEPLAALIARPGAYTSWEAWVWLHEAAGALAYLHDRGVHHGNLNLESVLVTSATHVRQVRLCRFGQAPDTSTAFASPEKADFVAAGQGGAPYDEAAADVWSLGVLVVTLLSRQPAPPPPDALRRLGGTATTEGGAGMPAAGCGRALPAAAPRRLLCHPRVAGALALRALHHPGRVGPAATAQPAPFGRRRRAEAFHLKRLRVADARGGGLPGLEPPEAVAGGPGGPPEPVGHGPAGGAAAGGQGAGVLGPHALAPGAAHPTASGLRRRLCLGADQFPRILGTLRSLLHRRPSSSLELYATGLPLHLRGACAVAAGRGPGLGVRGPQAGEGCSISDSRRPRLPQVRIEIPVCPCPRSTSQRHGLSAAAVVLAGLGSRRCGEGPGGGRVRAAVGAQCTLHGQATAA
jgi:hypothetical protein